MSSKKTLKQILSGSKNIRFSEFQNLLESFGFVLDRINGSHHIYKKNGINELINIQNVNGQIKPYQVNQFLKLVEEYQLKME